MVTSKHGYAGVATEEGGRKSNAVCKDYGRHFHPLHTFYSACNVPVRPQLAGKPQARILWLSDN